MTMKKILACLCLQAVTLTDVFSQRLTPIMGWSSWNTYRVNISDTLIMKQADALVSTGLKDVGYEFINIDDGFFGYRDSDGKCTLIQIGSPVALRLLQTISIPWD